MTCVFDNVDAGCCMAMFHDIMEISRLMVHAQQVETTTHKKKTRNAKKARSYDGVASKGNLEIQDKPRFKKRFSNQVPSNSPRVNKGRVFNPNP